MYKKLISFGEYMPLKSQHLRLVEDPTEFHHTIWRSGQSLVIKPNSVLPDCCLRCGAPAEGKTVQKWLFWHTPILLPVALLSWPFYLLLALVMRKTMVVDLPLCKKHIVLRKWLSILGVCLLPFAGILVLAALSQTIPLLLLAAIFTVIAAAVMVGWVRNPVWAVRIEEDLAFIRNVHPSILEKDSIPVWEDQDWSW